MIKYDIILFLFYMLRKYKNITSPFDLKWNYCLYIYSKNEKEIIVYI